LIDFFIQSAYPKIENEAQPPTAAGAAAATSAADNKAIQIEEDDPPSADYDDAPPDYKTVEDNIYNNDVQDDEGQEELYEVPVSRKVRSARDPRLTI
jgi:hypothetical protein